MQIQTWANTGNSKSFKLPSTHIVEFALVAIQRMILPVFALAVFVADEAPPLFHAARLGQSFTWRNVSCPETVYSLVA